MSNFSNKERPNLTHEGKVTPAQVLLQNLIEEGAVGGTTTAKVLPLTQAMAIQIIDMNGSVDKKTLFQWINTIEGERFQLQVSDCALTEAFNHIYAHLKRLYNEPEIEMALKRVRSPSAHAGLEKLVCQSLKIKKPAVLHDAYARRAVLSALLTPLRQNVGSCFATAPAIIIQAENPQLFLADMAQLLGLGYIRRTLSGVEYTVPLSFHVGRGDFQSPIDPSFFSDPKSIDSPSIQILKRALLEVFEKSFDFDRGLMHMTTVLEKKLGYFAFITPMDVASYFILQHLNITAEDVDAYKTYNPALTYATGIRKKMLLVEEYHRQIERVSDAFVAQTEHPLLKSWEYTLASFAEVKADISRWNLCVSLGFSSSSPYSLRQLVEKSIERELVIINDELAALQSSYDHTFAQVKYLEGRIKSASTEQEAKWIQSDYRLKRDELEEILTKQEKLHAKGRQLASLLKDLVDYALMRFPDFFQEIYDPNIKEIRPDFFADAPAGFRLLYKYGRSNPSVWTLIEDKEAYIKALTSFFTTIETELMQNKTFAAISLHLSQIVTQMVLAIKEPRFLEYSLKRLAEAYHEPLPSDPLNHLDDVIRKPWSYRSGGTMGQLVSTYFARSSPPTETKRWVESETELLAFYLDALKEMPLSRQQQFQKHPDVASILAYSPTHAFILKPMLEPFCEGWKTQAYTYSWVRDTWVEPQKAYWERLWLEPSHQIWLVDRLLSYFPKGYQPIVSQALKSMGSKRLKTWEFKSAVLGQLQYEQWLKKDLMLIDSKIETLLFQYGPAQSQASIEAAVDAICQKTLEIDENMGHQLSQLFEEELFNDSTVPAIHLLEKISQNLTKVFRKNGYKTPVLSHVIGAMRQLNLLPPSPILFADTNWPDKLFAFIVSPGNVELELWLSDHLGVFAEPMAQWKMYLNGQDRRDWGLYVKPSEYA
jgi:hypothetical protein